MADKDPQEQPTLTMAEVEAKIKESTEAAVAATEAKFTEQIGELQIKVTAAETAAADEKTSREAATTKLAAMEKEARELRFRDLIAGRGGEGDGAAWSGDSDKNLSVLVAMAESIGEESEAFKAHIENQKAIAAQAAEASLFKPVGSSASLPGASEPQARLDALVATEAAKQPDKTHQQVYSEVLETAEGKRLYEAIDASSKVMPR